ncbi:uncharacterized protein LOC133863662 [Alnus glutinosa]|uniref:uncharacterized protein LOC133863662 n=1 Tax=Alnus glutinosa TaxID=3517 RepID=UPI002D797206|nr:uncharacterized protein LOC133863662 [Alnus glutinosa]
MSQEEKGQAMAKPSITNHHLPESFCGSMKISKDVPSQSVIAIKDMFGDVEISGPVPENCNTKEFYSDLIRGHLKPQRVVRGRVTCLLTVTPAITNVYRTVHGGAIAAIAEMMSIASARTVVAEDKELFLGELSMSYLSGARNNEEVIVDGSVVRSGRNLSVVAVEFKLEKTGQLIYTARATFYHMPVAKL